MGEDRRQDPAHRDGDDRLAAGQLEAVLERLGFSEAPDPDGTGLAAVYLAWCRRVPFDNTQKLVALCGEAPGRLPVEVPREFFEQWLAHGTGATCWPSSNALAALLISCDFDARRVAGSMFENGQLTHGAVLVTVDGDDFLVDSSMLTDVPVPVTPTPSSVDHPVHPTAVEPVEGSYRFHFGVPFDPAGTTLFWRLMADPADGGLFAERYEASRQASVFNDSRYGRRNDADGVRALVKDTRFVKTASDFQAQAGIGPDEQDRTLIEDVGLSEQIVARLRAVLPGSSISGA